MIKLDEAIRTALEFEGRVHRTYQEAQEKAQDPVGRKVFSVLAAEELEHIVYLKSRLDEWQRTGRVTAAKLPTAIPDKARLQEAQRRMAQELDKKQDHTAEVQLLQGALSAEVETSAFYKRMVAELDEEGRVLFSRFVEIEEGHVAIVQAELDSVTGMGFWFDVQEFQLEAE